MADWRIPLRRADEAPAEPEDPGAEIPLSELGAAAIAAILADSQAKPEARVAAARAVLDRASDPESAYRGLIEQATATLREVLQPGGPASATAIVSAAKAATVEPPGHLEARIGILGIVARMASNADDRPAKARPAELVPAGTQGSASWWDRVFAEMDEGRADLDRKRQCNSESQCAGTAAQEDAVTDGAKGTSHAKEDKSK